MGHSKDMSYTYTHLDKSEIKNMLKNQVYKIEDLPEEKKHELEKEIDDLKMANRKLWEQLERIAAMARASYEAVTKGRNTEIALKNIKGFSEKEGGT